MSYGGSSGGSGRISTAADSALSNLANNDVLTYNSTTQKWTNQAQATATPATATTAGTVRLAGDLAGSSATPTLAAIGSGGSVGSASAIPVITYDTKGRITAATTANVASSGSSDTYTANSQAGSSYTLALSDAGKVIENTGTSALSITVPANASVAFPIGTTVELLNYSTGRYRDCVLIKSVGLCRSRAPRTHCVNQRSENHFYVHKRVWRNEPTKTTNKS